MNSMMTKTETLSIGELEKKSQELPLLLKALGHPSRVAIVEYLSKHQKCCGGDICTCLDLAQSTISQHLEILKKTGLVEVKTCGTKSIFCLKREKLFALGEALQAISQCECSEPVSCEK